jgi:hypothetical protein
MFAYRLAKDLGLKVKEVLEMTSAEFVGWIAFYKIEQEETRKAMNKAKTRR